MSFSIAGKTLKLDSAEHVAEITDQIEKLQDLEEIKLSGNTLGVEAAKATASLADKSKLKVMNGISLHLDDWIR
jgi:Ran GTPase-activating protein 1